MSKELVLSSNVKSKQNRLTIQRLLKSVAFYFKTRNSIPQNGLACFAGVDVYDKDFIEIFEPRVIISRFIYKCGSKFDDAAISESFQVSKSNKYLVTITGEETKLYRYCNDFKFLRKLNGLLIKRHGRGGQSSVRFSRLADESRKVYSTRIVDAINELCTGPTFVCGTHEMKLMVLSDSNLINKPTNLSEFTEIGDNFVNENKAQLVRFLSEEIVNIDSKVTQILELMQINPDSLTFGFVPLECEYIITTDETFEGIDKYVFIPLNSKYYSQIVNFVSIGKKYYAEINGDYENDF